MIANFISTILVLFDEINKNKSSATGTRQLVNNPLLEKQYLAYYIYRIWIKYRKLMEEVNTPTAFRKILAYLEIPEKYRQIYLTYPMANKMTINEKQLDLVIMSILQQFNMVYKTYGDKTSTGARPGNKDFTRLEKYMDGKSVENIVQDIIEIKLLLPNLSRPANVVNIWEGVDQILTDLDVIDEISGAPGNNNPATEIPDTKLIRQKSNTRANTRSSNRLNKYNAGNNRRILNNKSKPANTNITEDLDSFENEDD